MRFEPFIAIIENCTRTDHLIQIVKVMDDMYRDGALHMDPEDWVDLSNYVAKSKERIDKLK